MAKRISEKLIEELNRAKDKFFKEQLRDPGFVFNRVDDDKFVAILTGKDGTLMRSGDLHLDVGDTLTIKGFTIDYDPEIITFELS